jgi:hypothetical protein
MEFKDINNQFNYELQRQIDGTLPKGHIFYPKDQVKDIVAWSREGLLKYADKEKTAAFMKELRSQFPQTSFTNAEAYIDNIINNFEKSKGKGEKN